MRSDRILRTSWLILGLVYLLTVLFLLMGTSPAHGHGSQSGAMTKVYLPFVVKQPTETPLPPGWLVYLIYYRSMADLPSVAENSDWSYGNLLHARYMVKNEILQHDEDPANLWYTPEGQAAAQASNLAGSFSVNESDEWAIDTWMQAPFHAVGILDPRLLETGFGSYRETGAGLQMAAGLDVIRGQGPIPPMIRYPVMWPAQGETVPLMLHWGEAPSPLTSCPGYSAPTGLPIILQVGPGSLTPNVSDHSFKRGTTALDHCVFDETTYVNPDSTLQGLGRSILNARDAIVLIPREPLTPGADYTASITVDGQVYDWSFSVSSSAKINLIGDTGLVPRWDYDAVGE